jgi:NodT family efflux transporter outer membrane factor (OMF) lipoprotein
MLRCLPRQLSAVACSLLLCGCLLGPDYVRPRTPEPPAWHEPLGPSLTNAPPEKAQLATWWKVLDDPILSELVDRAVAENLDIRAAKARLRQVRARRDIARAGLYPTIRAELLGLDALWNIDVFGGQRRAVQGAVDDMGASREDLRDVLVTIVAGTVQSYVDLRSYETRLLIADKNLDAQSQTLQIATWRAQAGLTTVLDVEQARANVEQTRAQIPTLRAGLEDSRNRLSTLVAVPSGTLAEALSVHKPIPSAPKEVAVGVPADALAQRPDVRRAERQLAAETARVGSIRAEGYPSFAIFGSIGILPSKFSDYQFQAVGGVNIIQVLFDGGAIRAKIAAQQGIREEALDRYQSAVLRALEDVEDGIVHYSEEQNRRDSLTAAADSAKRAADLLRERYASGLVDFLSVLDASRSLYQLQDQLAMSQSQVVSNLIRLYRSLGGGWAPQKKT